MTAGRSRRRINSCWKGFQGQATVTVDADPDEVFAIITAIDRLPEWNARIAQVLEPPPDPRLPAGTEWVVQMVVPPARWASRSRVVACEADRGYFEYVSQSDDGNPSRITWRWSVSAEPQGTRVTVGWDAHVRTFWRRFLFGRLRRRQLASEVRASLAALAYHSAPREPAT